MKLVKDSINYWCDDIERNNYLGQGIGVAVLDTGVNVHIDFDSRIIAFKDVLHNKKKIYDDNGHGTHVCGIVGGSGRVSGGVYGGMAPRCNLIVVKVLDEKGNGMVVNVLKGLKWVEENKEKYNIRVVNVSVGTLPTAGNKEEKMLLDAVERLWDAGLVVIAAAGNYGPGAGTITTPGVSKKVITVGAYEDCGGKRKNYSGRGPTWECVCKPDVIAPGSYVISCNGQYMQARQKPYTRKSGTSMSTPVIAGAAALLLCKYPHMTNVEVKLKLLESCDDLGLPRNHQGRGMINIEKFLK